MNNEKFISVIMPSYLEDYSLNVNGTTVFAAKNREEKFRRAVNSVLQNYYPYKELIVVSDGCKKTLDLLDKYYKEMMILGHIKVVAIDKQQMFSGAVRQAGLNRAKGDIVCYCDTDDYLGENHLAKIAVNFDTDKYDWVFYNDFVADKDKPDKFLKRDVRILLGSIGTSTFAHKKSVPLVWQDGYNHDYYTIERFLIGKPYTKIPDTEYYVCHVSGWDIDV